MAQEFSKLNGYSVKDATARASIEALGGRVKTLEDGVDIALTEDSVLSEFISADESHPDTNACIYYLDTVNDAVGGDSDADEVCPYLGRAVDTEDSVYRYRFYKPSTNEILTISFLGENGGGEKDFEYTPIDQALSIKYEAETETLTLG